MGPPPDVNIEDLKEWLSRFGEIQSNTKMKKIKQVEALKNIGGIRDVSTLEVSMKAVRDPREKEFVEGAPVRVHHKGTPNHVSAANSQAQVVRTEARQDISARPSREKWIPKVYMKRERSRGKMSRN